ncbi:hypothetical protein RUND412_005921 [Rhizina undulata]
MGAADTTPDPILTTLIDQDTTPWYKKPNLRALYLTLVPACLGVEWTSGFDSSMMNGIQTIEWWETYFGHPNKARLGFMSASYSLGCILALPFVPAVNDRWGRRMSIVLGSLIMAVGAVLQGAAINFAMFVIARIILGFGIPFAIVAASSLIGELSHPKERPILTSLFNSSWFVGAIVAAGVTLGTFNMETTWSWRIPSYLQLVPSVMQLTFIWWIPESPRYLISKDRHEEARAILVKYHAEGDEDSELAAMELAQIQATIKAELENKKMTWRQYFTTSANRKRAVLALCMGVFSQWSGNGPLSFYLKKILEQVGIDDGRRQNLVNLGMTCWSLVNGICMALSVRRFKRRTMFLTCIAGMLGVYLALTISAARYAMTGATAAGVTTVVFIFLYSPFYNMGFNALTYTYLIELFPFTIRSKGITMQQWWSRAATFMNTFVNPIGMDNVGWRYYIYYCVWISFEGVVIYFIFPETSHRTLEELAFLFEGKEAQDEVNKKVEKELIEHEHRENVLGNEVV